jgi:DnaD/phage-associated family protein
MSVKIMGFVWDLDIPQNEKLVLLAYADHASHDGSNIYPAVSTIAKKTGYSERSVQMITRALEGRGYLVSDGQGTHGTNKWRIPLYMGGIIPMISRGADSAPVQSTTEGGAEIEPLGVKPTAPEPSFNHPLTVNTTTGEIFKAYQSEIGPLTGFIADDIGADLDTIKVPPEYFIDAIHEAVLNQKRNWKYCRAILLRWEREGKVPLVKSSNGKKVANSRQAEIEKLRSL